MKITNIQVNWLLTSSPLATSPINLYFSAWELPHLHCYYLPYIVHDDGEEEIHLLTCLLTYVRQLFVICSVQIINSIALCVMPVDANVSAVQ